MLKAYQASLGGMGLQWYTDGVYPHTTANGVVLIGQEGTCSPPQLSQAGGGLEGFIPLSDFSFSLVKRSPKNSPALMDSAGSSGSTIQECSARLYTEVIPEPRSQCLGPCPEF